MHAFYIRHMLIKPQITKLAFTFQSVNLQSSNIVPILLGLYAETPLSHVLALRNT
jgi:hypothetical protein